MSDSPSSQTHIINCHSNASTIEQTLRQNGIDCELVRSTHDCHRAPACQWLKNAPLSQEARLVAAIDQTISVLQHSRHAFKSKDLAVLRRDLEKLLAERQNSQAYKP